MNAIRTTSPSAAALATTSEAAPPVSSPYSSRLAKRLARSREFWAQWLRDPGLDVAEAVLRLRRFRGWSQEELADRMGTTQSSVARIERGRANVRLSTLVKLAEALNTTVRIDLEPVEMLERWPHYPRWWEREADGSLPYAALPTAEHPGASTEGPSLHLHLTVNNNNLTVVVPPSTLGLRPESAVAHGVTAEPHRVLLTRADTAVQP